MTTRIAPSAALEAAIEEFLAEGLGDGERLAEIGRLGARLVLQRAVEEEVTAFLGRARYERTPAARGSRNENRAAPGADRRGRAGDPGAAGPRRGGEVREQRDPERADGAADAAAGGADHRWLGARAVGPRHREPGQRGGAGPDLEEHGERDHQGVAGALPGVPPPELGRGEAAGAVLRRDLPADQAERRQGGRAGGLG